MSPCVLSFLCFNGAVGFDHPFVLLTWFRVGVQRFTAGNGRKRMRWSWGPNGPGRYSARRPRTLHQWPPLGNPTSTPTSLSMGAEAPPLRA